MPSQRLAARARQLRSCSLSEIVVLFQEWVDLPERPPGERRQRVFTLWRTFWLFLSQVLAPGQSCCETVAKANGWLCLQRLERICACNSAYCQARARLVLSALERVWKQVSVRLQSQVCPADLWLGRPVKIVDGTSLSMPDTPANQALYPQPSAQKAGCGFPVLRLVVLFSLVTGAILAVAKGALDQAERTLWRQLWDLLEPGDIALSDRGFCSYAEFLLLVARGVDCVSRLQQCRSVGVRVIRRLGRGQDDLLVDWLKTNVCPNWMTRQQWAALPPVLRVRHVHFFLAIPGFRTREVTLATTLLDPVAYPYQALVELYRRRWLAELFLRDIKISMGMDVLRCKSPDMIHRELAMHLCAYNLLRALMFTAAREHHVDAFRISFKGALGLVRQWAPLLASASASQVRRMLKAFFACMADSLIPDRPNRVEPRARKRRPKNYPILNKPRKVFKELPHRNRYKKALS